MPTLYQYELLHRFTYHKPTERQADTYEDIRNGAKEYAMLLSKSVPDCEERDIAIRKLQEVVFWANAAIALRSEKNEI